MKVPAEFERHVREVRNVVATGLDTPLLGAVVDVLGDDSSAERDGTEPGPADAAEPWRIVLDPAVTREVAYEFVLATALQQLRTDGLVELRTSEEPQRTLVAGTDATIAIAGPETNPTMLVDEDPATVDGVREETLARFERATRATLDEPSRRKLIDSAAATLSESFATELDAVLDGADHLHRHHEVDALTLVLAVGARTDHLFSDVRVWAEKAGVAAREQFVERKDELVTRGLVETIKIPMGTGHPRNRLRTVDEALAECSPQEVLWVLRDRYGVGSGSEANVDQLVGSSRPSSGTAAREQ